MKQWAGIVFSMSVYVMVGSFAHAHSIQSVMDPATAGKVDLIARNTLSSSPAANHGTLIENVSASFLGTPYRAGLLNHAPSTPELLVANFNGVDCLTFIEYTEALTHSHNRKTFLQWLARVRYAGGKIAYLSRRHYFTDWYALAPCNARDVTTQVSSKYISVDKQLNKKEGDQEYVPGLGIHARKIFYIPGNEINRQLLNKLKTGDYIGVYSALIGLDVSHVGIVVRHDGRVWFRNASSLPKNRKVVDSPFLQYMQSKPGIVVLRAN